MHTEMVLPLTPAKSSDEVVGDTDVELSSEFSN